MNRIQIGNRWIGENEPTYFIADISANHDGQLSRATELIRLAAEAGADAAKFQHFRAAEIVSRTGFEDMGDQLSHQAKWEKSVFEVYQDASLPWKWTSDLKKTCEEAGIEFFSAPYDFEAVEMLDPYVNVFKIGSGDITWPEMLRLIAGKGKPVILATGASEMKEVESAVETIQEINDDLVLMQCNTNYTAGLDNFRHIHLNVLKTYRRLYPNVVLGLSDHTPGHATVLGSVALGARVIEKHFTDDTSREGPDHPFSMTPASWQEMVDRTRELENALGSESKTVAKNEEDTVVVQRRCLRAAAALEEGTTLKREDIKPLRPAPPDAVFPYDIDKVVGRVLRRPMKEGDYFKWTDLD